MSRLFARSRTDALTSQRRSSFERFPFTSSRKDVQASTVSLRQRTSPLMSAPSGCSGQMECIDLMIYETWEQATIYEHQPAEDIFGPSPSPPTDVGLMSHQEWDALDSSARECLYDEYQQDVQATDEYFARFASAVLAAASPRHTILPNSHPADTDAMQLLRCYGRASARLPQVQTFSHVPAYRVDALGWGETWRNIAFHVFASVEIGWGHDPYYDAVQLFAALAFSQFSTNPVTLRSLTLTTQGGLASAGLVGDHEPKAGARTNLDFVSRDG